MTDEDKTTQLHSDDSTTPPGDEATQIQTRTLTVDPDATDILDPDATDLLDPDATGIINNTPDKQIANDDTTTPLEPHDHSVSVSVSIENEATVISNSDTVTEDLPDFSLYERKKQLKKKTNMPFTEGGDIIKERFVVKRILGRGGMGMVCQALDLRKVEANDEQPHIAVKVLTGDFQRHPNAFISLQREAKKTQALAHPNIVTVYDFDRDGDTVFMTMEELDGWPLDQIIKGNTDFSPDRETALKMILEIALALEYAHSKGIIHSDLKPGNIFYTKTGITKVLDFGIARALNNEFYKDNFDAGDLNALTPKYASLEMFERKDPHPKDDIYALGLIAAQLLTGDHPYNGENAQEVKKNNLKPELSTSVGRLVRKLIFDTVAIDAEKRTDSVTTFIKRLHWAQKGPKRLAIAATVAVALVIGNAFLIDSVDDDIPLSDLPAAEQQVVTDNLAQATMALKFKDYNGAIIYLEKAYQVHPTNDDIEQLSEEILAVYTQQLSKIEDTEQKQFLHKQLNNLSEYPFISNLPQFQVLLQKTQ